MREVAKLRERDRVIWDLIVKYANADLDSDVRDVFVSLFKTCVKWIDPSVGMMADSIPAAFCKELSDARQEGTSESALAIQYQSGVRQILQWITEPQQTDPETAAHALAFLRTNVDGVKRVFDLNDEFDPNLRSGAFYVETPIEFSSVVSPTCMFIWKQMERYREGDGELKELVPLGTCKRCGNFFLSERVRRKEFCSNSCRSGFRQDHMTQEEKAERMRKYRATLKKRKRKQMRIMSARKEKKGK